jgi:hypothetical protein
VSGDVKSSKKKRPQRDSPALLGLRAIWVWTGILFVPIVVALTVLVPLALTTKSATVDMSAVTYRASFALLGQKNGSEQVELVRSLPAASVTLIGRGAVEIAPSRLEDARTGVPIRAETLKLSPHANGWVEFKADGDRILLSELLVEAASPVDLTREGTNLQIKVQPRERAQGKISLNGSSTLIVMDCDITDKDGKRLDAIEGQQQPRFRLGPGTQPVLLNSSTPVDLRLEVDENDKDFKGSFGDNLSVNHLAFPPGSRSTTIPVQSATIGFRNLNRPNVVVQAGFVRLHPADVFEVIAIGSHSGALDLRVSGAVRSLNTGALPGREELPTLLEWLYHDQTLAMVAGILLWVSGTVVAAIKLMSVYGEGERS